MVVRPHTSAAGVLALLSEPEIPLKVYALKALNPLVPQFWAEISEQVALIESLYESNELPKDARSAAALLASKVYYYLGEYDEALSFALGAGPAFSADIQMPGSEEYTETIISKAIDRYVAARIEESAKGGKVDPKLQSIVESIFKRCIDEGEHKQAIGIALEAHRLDIVKYVFELNKDVSLLSYAMDAVLETNFPITYRDEVLRFLYPLFPPPEVGSPNIIYITRLLVTLDDTSLTLALLKSLVPKDKLLAYQIAFDLVEAGAQDFLETLRNELPEGDEESQPIFEKLRQILSGRESIKLYLDFLKSNNKVDLLILKGTRDVLESRTSIYHNALTFQHAFMHSGTTSDIFLRENLEWLGKAYNWSKFTATAALGVIHKGHFEEGMNILGPYLPTGNSEGQTLPDSQYSEGGSLYALGLINTGCGSNVEGYLREKLKSNTNEVVQHGAALGLGVAGMGSKNFDAYDDLRQVVYGDFAVSGEAAGYGMGLVMLGTGEAKYEQEMLSYARDTKHEKIIRGLAVGIAFLHYGRQEQADEAIKSLLAEKDPLLRYGGVYTLALAYAGTSNNGAIRKLLHLAVSDTSDDVRRAAVTSLAFLLFKNPSQVPRIVQLLSESYNPHVRCGATLALGIACAGTGLQDAVEILEPMTKDSVDFVRQGALIALGMVLVQQSEAASPSMSSTRALYTKVTADKHEDPMARFGAALGQGLIDAGGRNVTISLQSRAGGRNTSAIVGMVLFCQFWYWYPLALCASLSFQPTAIIGITGDLKLPKFEFTSNARPSLFAYPQPAKPPTKEAVGRVAAAVLSTTAKAKARERTKEKEKAAVEGDMMDTDEKEVQKPASSNEDVEMKVDEPSTSAVAAHGDISPITGTISNLPDALSDSKPDSKAQDAPKKPARKSEPSFEKLSNLSRVTPAQLSHVSFAPEGRYIPVRPVSSVSGKGKAPQPAMNGSANGNANPAVSGSSSGVTSASQGSALSGGGILLLIDQQPDEPAEYLDSELHPPAPEPVAAEPEVIPVEQLATASTTTESSGQPQSTVSRPHIALDENAPEADPPESFEYPFDEDK